MRTALSLLLMSYALVLSGCATQSPAQKAQAEADAALLVTCQKGDDCEEKWGRAIAWIAQNSHWKIQMQNENIIQTYNGIGASTDPGYLVNKVPLGGNRYQITIAGGCANLFGCVPDFTVLKANFNRFVQGPGPSQAATGDAPTWLPR